MRPRPWRAWLAAALVGLALTFSPRAAAQSDTVTFRAQGVPETGDDSVEALAARTVLREFLRQHPRCRVEPFAMPSLQGVNIDSGPLMAIAAGLPPHAIYVNFRQSSTYIAQGFLAPVEDLLARVLSADERVREADATGHWRADPPPGEVARAVELVRQRVPAPAWPVVYRRDESSRDPTPHIWAVPTSNVVMALMYRRDLFHDAGLDPDRPPRDWDELLDYARRLTDPRRGQYGMIVPSEEISWGIYTLLVSNGARLVTPAPDGGWRASYDSREAAEAILFVWRLLHEPWERDGRRLTNAGKLANWTEMDLGWKRGQFAMQFMYLDEELLTTTNPQLVGLAAVPRAPRGARGSEVNCKMLGVFSGATPAQQLAVVRYIWFVSGEEAKRLRTAVYVDNDMGRFVNPTLLEQFGYQRLLRQVPAGWKEAFADAMRDGVPEPYGRNTQNIYRYMSEPVNAALELPLGDLPREEALRAIERLLHASAQEVNTRVLGSLPAAELSRRRGWAGAVVVAVALAFTLGLGHVWRHFTRLSAAALERRSWRKLTWGYALLLPALALILFWEYLTLTGGLAIGFLDFRLARDSAWVGLDNFAAVLFEQRFWAALGRSVYFAALMIGLGFWPPILLAVLLHEVPTRAAKYIFRTIYFLPAVVSGLIVMFLWKQLYDPSPDGVLNQLLLSLNHLDGVSATLVKLAVLGVWLALIAVLARVALRLDDLSRTLRVTLALAAAVLVGVTLWPLLSAWRSSGGGAALAVVGQAVGRFELKPMAWLQAPEWAMLCVVIPAIWAGAGPGCILYLAALKTVPEELYEAADLDGASAWHKVFFIVLPKLKYLIVIQFMGAVIGAFRGGVEYLMVMTAGGPNNATTVLPLEIFRRAFMELNYGVATAMAWILGALLIGFAAYQLKVLAHAEFRAGG